MSDSVASRPRRSARSAKPSDRASAIDRLRALRQSAGGRRSDGVQVKLDEPIYDTVAEEDYARLVAQRRESARAFIVDDDDSLGYGDEGEEEDWAQPALPPDSDGDEEDDATRKKKPIKEPPQPKKPKATPTSNSLSAAAALTGRHRLSSMFTSSSALKRGERGKASESIVDELIAEFAPDETDREERRRKRGLSTALPPTPPIQKPPIPPPSLKVERSVLPASVASVPVEESNVETMGGGVVDNADPSDAPLDVAEEVDKVKEEGTVEAKAEVKAEVKAEEAAPEVDGPRASTLNAKIKVETGDGKVASATAGWKAICEVGEKVKPNGELGGRVAESGDCKHEESSEIPLDSDGKLRFFLLDAHEESFGPNPGRLFLFGKVKVGTKYHSCCVVVNNMQRCVYAIPKDSVFPDDAMTDLENDLERKKISMEAFRKTVQGMAVDLKNEIAKHLLDLNVSTFSMMPVKRSYAFERSDIPAGEQYVLKINYPFKDKMLQSDLKGDLFHSLLGTNSSALELFLVKRKIQGPSWLSISKFVCSASFERVSWCKFEVVVDDPKDICIVSTSKTLLEMPPIVATAINLKTILNEKHGTNEIVSASVICCHEAKIDGPMLASEWKKPGVLSHFTVLRKLDGCIFPMGFTNEVRDRNLKAGSDILSCDSSERALINRLMIELHKLDTDVLVGHNISGFDLDVLLHRAQACMVPSIMWSKIGRLKRSVMPKLTKGSTLYGSGASAGILSCIAGRLLCDTYLCSRDLLREVSYSLTQLSKSQLNKERKEITPQEIPSMFQEAGSLLELVECGETDAWLSLELMFHLSILPLTRQLTNISGNLWGKTLQGARAQRVEFLLLHAFHAKKYMVPDKNVGKGKELKTVKRRLNSSGLGGERAEESRGNVDVSDENDVDYVDQGKGKKGAAYAGGLVLEPKKGLYDKIILLLDFNSLYPSIIQEYNICFTTVERSGGSASGLPSSRVGVLPELLSYLVERRKSVKKWLKTATGLRVQQLDIQQQALKLTANSIYGCLGFSNSRFYAKPIAELITLQGREILQNTVDLVQNILNLEVIYGDTDSIMINSGLDDFAKAKAMAGKVIQEVNKKYNCLEIDLDGLYKRMLLLKKKKYAAVKVLFKEGAPYEVIERKGLDMVRRDWSLLSKELGDFCLCQILSGGSCEEVVETIHSSLMKVQEEMRNGEVSLEKYVITKSLTKSPEEYSDAKNQPHVQVALRLKQSGYNTGFSAGDTVPYIVCCEQGGGSGSSIGIAERARHPDELRRDNGNWMVDIEYYLSQQIHPVVSRLCASIQGTSPARLADCLGLDSSKFQREGAGSISKDPYVTYIPASNDDDRYHGCEPLRLSCPSCSTSFECPPVYSSLAAPAAANQTVSESDEASGNSFWDKLRCPRCPDDIVGSRISSAMLVNQVKRQAENYISFYYKGCMVCDDDLCKFATRNINLRVVGDSERGTVCPNFPRCNGHLMRQYTEADLYKQLSYFYHILDTKRFTDKIEIGDKVELEKRLLKLQPFVEQAAETIQKIRDRCAYGWVRLEDIAISV